MSGHDLAIGESVVGREFPPEMRDEWTGYYQRALAGERFSALTEHELPVGRRYFQNSFNPIVDPRLGVIGVSVVSQDKTARQQTEDALRASEARFRTLAAASPLGIFLTDARGEVVYANPRLLEIWRLPAGEPFGRAAERLSTPTTSAGWRTSATPRSPPGRRWRRTSACGSPTAASGTCARGWRRCARATASPASSARWTTTPSASSSRSACGRARRWSRSARWPAGSRTTSTTCSASCSGTPELALADAEEVVAEGHSLRESLHEIRTASLRARDLVRQILTFSRRSEQQTTSVDLRALTVESLRMLRATIPSTVTLDARLPEGPVPVLGDPTGACSRCW